MNNRPCKKVKFANEAAAQFHIEKLKRTSIRERIPQRSYLCYCGGWHLTSQESYIEHDLNILKDQITDLEKQIAEKNTEINLLQGQHTKEENIFIKLAFRLDERIKIFIKTYNTQQSIIRNLRINNSELITKIIKLENENTKLKENGKNSI